MRHRVRADFTPNEKAPRLVPLTMSLGTTRESLNKVARISTAEHRNVNPVKQPNAANFGNEHKIISRNSALGKS